jgi:Glu-tRNA(Gln) amidotransferase subunit E-like FAD-binding protein
MVIQIAAEPTVERWPAHANRYVVTYRLSGARSLGDDASRRFEVALQERVAIMGLEYLFSQDELKLYGVRPGDETGVHNSLIALIREQNELLAHEQEQWEAGEPARREEARRLSDELEVVQDAFRKALEANPE